MTAAEIDAICEIVHGHALVCLRQDQTVAANDARQLAVKLRAWWEQSQKARRMLEEEFGE